MLPLILLLISSFSFTLLCPKMQNPWSKGFVAKFCLFFTIKHISHAITEHYTCGNTSLSMGPLVGVHGLLIEVDN